MLFSQPVKISVPVFLGRQVYFSQYLNTIIHVIYFSTCHTVIFYDKIDCINYFVHREMNLKKRIAHLMKSFSVRFGFIDSLFDEQNNLYSQYL